MAVVYWVHKIDQDMVGLEGYIGVTNNFSNRCARHKSNAKNNKQQCAVFENAINKYGDELVWEIIFEGSRKDCLLLEEVYRPESHIGWNIAKGGYCGVDNTGKVHSTATKKLWSAQRKGSNNQRATKVKCVNTGEVFSTLKFAAVFAGLTRGSDIAKVCKGKKCSKGFVMKTAGKHPETHEKLSWEFVDAEVVNNDN